MGKIAWGSIKNKLLFLLPAALLLSFFAPWLMTPLLMIGGAYLCYEGAEKVFHMLAPHEAEHHEAGLEPTAIDPQTLEDQKVGGAIKTDFILSAEIMTIILAAIEVQDFWTRAAILAVAGIGITVVVYGARGPDRQRRRFWRVDGPQWPHAGWAGLWPRARGRHALFHAGAERYRYRGDDLGRWVDRGAWAL